MIPYNLGLNGKEISLELSQSFGVPNASECLLYENWSILQRFVAHSINTLENWDH